VTNVVMLDKKNLEIADVCHVRSGNGRRSSETTRVAGAFNVGGVSSRQQGVTRVDPEDDFTCVRLLVGDVAAVIRHHERA